MNGRHEIEKHPILGDLDVYAGFYEALSTSVFQWVTGGTHALTNLDTYLFSALQGTLSSIRLILAEGRINDAYTLLRKYHDLAVANLYTNIFLKENFSADNFIVQQIDDWRSGKAKLPEYRVMNQYVRAASCLSPVTDLLFADDRYKQLRERCNDHTHYNYYRSMLFNDASLYLPGRTALVDQLALDARDLFILHFVCLFTVMPHYMSSSDHLDALELGLQPENGSEYWVAPFIQDVFDNVVVAHRPDLAGVLKSNSSMQIE